jgi:6-pyruvoyltetrahydropterin/6-carboxytetrahydropterin synthase
MYSVTKTYGHELGLSACFRQWRAKSHCRFLHGYALSFKLEFEARELDANGWVFDFGALKPIKQFLCDTFDHKLVVAFDDPQLDEITALGGLGIASPLVIDHVGCEAFAFLVHRYTSGWLGREHTSDRLARQIRLASVEVREHAGNSAIYRAR